MQSADILILSNGPGEIATWVRPVVKALRDILGNDRDRIRISLILSPCPHATNREMAIARSYGEIDRIQGAEHFFEFLIWGKTAENWDWRQVGVVLFLGGDQLFAAIAGKRLGYRTVVYAEWEARWYRQIDCFAAMNSAIFQKIPAKFQSKVSVVGDLIVDIPQMLSPSPSPYLIALLPGSKSAKLAQGVPLCLAIAESIAAKFPDTRFIIPVAPTLDLNVLASFADRDRNPVAAKFGEIDAQLIYRDPDKGEKPSLKTAKGLVVELVSEFPAHAVLSQCHLALTTVGANTAELGALAVPMIILLPTQQLDAMRAWDGIPGILANLPLVGSAFAKLINWIVFHNRKLYAWPNIWAKEEIVPELAGELQAGEVARMAIDFLTHPDKLEQMRDRLRRVRGESGAAAKIARLVSAQISN